MSYKIINIHGPGWKLQLLSDTLFSEQQLHYVQLLSSHSMLIVTINSNQNQYNAPLSIGIYISHWLGELTGNSRNNSVTPIVEQEYPIISSRVYKG
jgi:hypothetical protein